MNMKNILIVLICFAIFPSCAALDYSTSKEKMLHEISALRAEFKKLKCTKKAVCIGETFTGYGFKNNETMVIYANMTELYIYIDSHSAYTIQLNTGDDMIYYSLHPRNEQERKNNQKIESSVASIHSVAFTGK